MLRTAIALLVLAAPLTAQTGAQTKPLDPANRDTTCSACGDFYRWANGGWISRTPIPGDQPMWSSFHELQDRNFAAIRTLLDQAAAGARSTRDPDARRLGLRPGLRLQAGRPDGAARQRPSRHLVSRRVSGGRTG